mmetsp:Transcript_26191/g.44659  ORF Transcript_26191/g.44659 Transcript_26191/m.44659 type:complete len:521 (+) Transcript_26191:130-1692(+)|eukprot:CAMPEP_0183768902 /NCGR_PEP_ID=MMETSP0739-20130205/19337_1 /TAXON_ID=385413 /ORGANISM="Thalassiosira miniscula, Strain CCMP1093" /LENGTH=520 /DNA_ID=CAMNT_0026008335 /DNA_START=112 /DNA_END=1674 /DNA_ORIENTATION=+
MAAKPKPDSDSSSSSSSSSDEEESLIEQRTKEEAAKTGDDTDDAPATTNDDDDVDDTQNDDGNKEDNGGNEENDDDDDKCKVFLSRIPQTFTDESIKRILESKFGEGCVVEASIVGLEKDNATGDSKGDGAKKGFTKSDNTDDNAKGEDVTANHRGFGFVTFASSKVREAAIEAGTVRGSAKVTSKRKHTLYIRPIVRDDDGDEYAKSAGESNVCSDNKNICFLWKKFRCPYGDNCKFVHEGDGGCANAAEDEKKSEKKTKKKKQKCFSFKKNGKCKLGENCPYSHDFVVTKKQQTEGSSEGQLQQEEQSNNDDKCTIIKKDKSLIDCINWKNKGKCRKGSKCPYRHDEAVRDAKRKKKDQQKEKKRSRDDASTKHRQSLSVRVFGLNYSTTEEDVREYFSHCGPIMEITFPTFEDSGRSRGYCGVLFTSPKAVAKAIELDGNELHGRWLRIQEGKMFLRKWEEVENERRTKGNSGGKNGDEDWNNAEGDGGEGEKKQEAPLIGEYGQKVKRRKRHGFKD